MKMHKDEVEDNKTDQLGYCSECDTLTMENVKPDMTELFCDECGEHSVMGVTQGIDLGFIELISDDDGTVTADVTVIKF